MSGSIARPSARVRVDHAKVHYTRKPAVGQPA